MVLATVDPVLLSLTWSGLAIAAADYGLLVRRRAAQRIPKPVEHDDAVLRHLVQVLVINDQPSGIGETSPRP